MTRAQLLMATALTPIALMSFSGTATAQTAYDWSGFYVGLVGGGHYNEADIEDDFVPPEDDDIILRLAPGILLPGIVDAQTSGFVGFGGGFNYQSGQFVLGVEGDVNFTGINGTVEGDTGVVTDYTIDALLTLRGRAGFAMDRTLFFATAGLAAAKTTLSTSFNDGGKGAQGTASPYMFGLIGGLGVEHAVTDNMSVKFEGLVYNLGSASVDATGDDGYDYTATVRHAGFLARIGINIHL